jgi:hypothetical protein
MWSVRSYWRDDGMKLGGKKPTVKKAGQLRRSQLITTHGCGAIVDLPRESVIIAGTDYWRNHDRESHRLYEDNLQKLLGVDFFVCPPADTDETGLSSGYGIPAFLFPTWMYCPKCKRLASSNKFDLTFYPRCQKCDVRLVPSRFVVACENGHLDDFPYEWWVRKGRKCPEDRRPELFIEMIGDRSGLDSIIVSCKKCEDVEKHEGGCSRSMAGSFGGESLRGYSCSRKRPWLKDRDPSECDKPARTMLRGATNLYFGINIGALSIPPWSRKIQIALSENWRKLKPFLNDRAFFENMVKGWEWPEKYGCPASDIWDQAIIKEDNENSPGAKNWQEILEGEYRAFLVGSDEEGGEFKTAPASVPSLLGGYIERIVLAMRLREVMALRGFRRIDPNYDIDDDRSFTKLSREFKNWLPAIELKGEGIFIQLDESRLRDWENRADVGSRYMQIGSANGPSMIKGPGFSPRYILLHTLAHLLIRQLILQCGYSSAAIKERIYCTFAGREHPLEMAGILIYTATNDSEGSLGGLVREGRTERIDNTFRQMLEAASWCSSDPLCITTAHGIDGLNLAACHSCTLLPETSCEARNCYLDRAALIGTLDNSSIGFFCPLLNREE